MLLWCHGFESDPRVGVVTNFVHSEFAAGFARSLFG